MFSSKVAILFIFFVTNTFASILPKNNLKLPVTLVGQGIDRTTFDAVIDKVEKIYAPIVAGMGGKLIIRRDWENATVNAYATRSKEKWMVQLFGGLARHKFITADSLALTVCHEIGHHLGGAPKSNKLLGGVDWMTNEGQADYFATLKCLRQVFLNDDNAEIVRNLNAPEKLVSTCRQHHPNKLDQDICIRSGMAGFAMTNILFTTSYHTGATPRFENRDPKVVKKTNAVHPAPQCRLDTYFEGALCEKVFSEDVSQTDELPGTCHGATGQTIGLRPRCWFAP